MGSDSFIVSPELLHAMHVRGDAPGGDEWEPVNASDGTPRGLRIAYGLSGNEYVLRESGELIVFRCSQQGNPNCTCKQGR